MATVADWHQLREDLHPYLPLLAQAADAVVDQEVSNYPLFVAYHGEEVAALGLPVLREGTVGGSAWSINVSTLEELVARNVIGMERIDNFRQVYRGRAGSLCFLIWQDQTANFAFLPRPGEETRDEEE